MACIVCVEWEETTGRRAGATRSAHRIGLTYRMGRPRSARRPGVISPVRWNGGIPHADLFDRRRHLPGSMERGTVSILSRATPTSFPRFAESAGHDAACNPRGGRGLFSLHSGDTLPQSSRGVVFPIRPIDPGGVGNCQARNGGSEDFVVSDCAALDRNRVE